MNHSLVALLTPLVVQVHAELSAHSDRSISMVDLFKHPIISALSEYLGRSDPSHATPPQPDEQLQTVKAGRIRLKQRAEHHASNRKIRRIWWIS
jgi:hypothetical protein